MVWLRFSFLMMNYDEVIFKVLKEAGSGGLSVGKVSYHVYNACNSLFHSVELSEVWQYVSQYLIRHSRNPYSMVEKTEKRGVYRLNFNSSETCQLLLKFADAEEPEKPAQEDTSLDLFANC